MRHVLLPLILLSWIVGGLGARVHELQHTPTAHGAIVDEAGAIVGEADEHASTPTVASIEHSCAYELCDWSGELSGRPPGGVWVVRPLRQGRQRLPGAPRGPPILGFAPKTSPPSSV